MCEIFPSEPSVYEMAKTTKIHGHVLQSFVTYMLSVEVLVLFPIPRVVPWHLKMCLLPSGRVEGGCVHFLCACILCGKHYLQSFHKGTSTLCVCLCHTVELGDW